MVGSVRELDDCLAEDLFEGGFFVVDCDHSVGGFVGGVESVF